MTNVPEGILIRCNILAMAVVVDKNEDKEGDRMIGGSEERG